MAAANRNRGAATTFEIVDEIVGGARFRVVVCRHRALLA